VRGKGKGRDGRRVNGGTVDIICFRAGWCDSFCAMEALALHGSIYTWGSYLQRSIEQSCAIRLYYAQSLYAKNKLICNEGSHQLADTTITHTPQCKKSARSCKTLNARKPKSTTRKPPNLNLKPPYLSHLAVEATPNNSPSTPRAWRRRRRRRPINITSGALVVAINGAA